MVIKIIFIAILFIVAIPAIAIVIPNKDLGINQRTTTLANPITNAYSSPITIDRPGCYRLGSNLINKKIIIDSDDVTLALNGFSINNPALNDHSIVIITGHSDIVIQGGEISGDLSALNAGVFIEDSCSNILIQRLKISNEYYGVQCFPSNISGVVIRECTMSNCVEGIIADDTINLRIKQCLISAPAINIPLTATFGIDIFTSSGCTIDKCTLSYVNNAIYIAQNVGIVIKDSIVNFLTIFQAFAAGIFVGHGSSNVVDNCQVNAIKGTANRDFYGILINQENGTTVKNCVVNNIYPDTGIIIQAFGIAIVLGNNCIVQDNSVANIFGNDPANTSYGYFSTVGTSTFTFIDNKAINCANPDTQPYTANIPFVVTVPQATIYPWNWIRS